MTIDELRQRIGELEDKLSSEASALAERKSAYVEKARAYAIRGGSERDVDSAAEEVRHAQAKVDGLSAEIPALKEQLAKLEKEESDEREREERNRYFAEMSAFRAELDAKVDAVIRYVMLACEALGHVEQLSTKSAKFNKYDSNEGWKLAVNARRRLVGDTLAGNTRDYLVTQFHRDGWRPVREPAGYMLSLQTCCAPLLPPEKMENEK